MQNIKWLKYGALFLTFISLLTASWYVLHGDILFHTDIARDFLLFEDMTTNKLLTLIGPRSGGIPGVFHGPLWLYLNLPSYVIGSHNPVAVGWFWVLLFIVSVLIVYYVSYQFNDQKTAIITASVYSLISARAINSLFNPYGAVILSPLFLLFFYQYLKSHKIQKLILAFFILGLMIQFQIAFGLPILALTVVYLIIHLYQQKKLNHLLSSAVLVIPLSSYFLFEIRHQFLQVRAILNFINPLQKSQDFKWVEFILIRLRGFFVDGVSLIPEAYYMFALVLVTFPLILLSRNYIRSKKHLSLNFCNLFGYFYIGFWIITFFYKGTVWGYYFWPFLPVSVIVFTSLIIKSRLKIFYVFLGLIILANIYLNVRHIIQANSFIAKDASSWRFNYETAKRVFGDTNQTFGYFVYTPDLFGYSPRFALDYVQRHMRRVTATPFKKQTVSYLLIAAAPTDRPYLDGTWWRKNQVKIDKLPSVTWRYPNGFRIEKYLLTSEETHIDSDPNLIQSLHFR